MVQSTTGPVQSVVRAFSLLEVLAECADGIRLKDIAERVELTKSTAQNLLSTLETLGYAAQPRSGGPYVLGPKASTISRGLEYSDERLREIVRPALERIAALTGETCYLGVPIGIDFLYLDVLESHQPIRLVQPVNARTPLSDSAIGRVLLAFQPETAARLRRQLGSAWSSLEPIVSQVEVDGFALDLEESAPGQCCVALPVRHSDGVTRAAIGVCGPAFRLDEARLRAWVPELLEILTSSISHESRNSGF